MSGSLFDRQGIAFCASIIKFCAVSSTKPRTLADELNDESCVGDQSGAINTTNFCPALFVKRIVGGDWLVCCDHEPGQESTKVPRSAIESVRSLKGSAAEGVRAKARNAAEKTLRTTWASIQVMVEYGRGHIKGEDERYIAANRGEPNWHFFASVCMVCSVHEESGCVVGSDCCADSRC